ncbi:MAG TPA: alpha/beta hydrolase [Euzebyales bacterium]|nr:alpha/beta hydrolase [Euzebyales bacterium]
MPTIEVNGTGLEYTEQGAGEPVVFVHGGLNDLRAWNKQLPAFASTYRTVAYSCRSYYPNERPLVGVAITLDTHVDDLVGLLRALDLTPAHLIGASNGGFVCLLLARRMPELVRTLVLADPPVLPLLGVSVPPRPTQLLRLLLRDPRTGIDVIRFGAKGIGPTIRAFTRGDDERGLEIFVTAALGRADSANLSADMRCQIRDNVQPFKAQLRAGFPAFDEDDARRISAPTLLVNGERGAPVLHRVTDKLERLMLRAERIHIPDTSHLMYADDPEAFNHAVLKFLERHSEPSLTGS